MRGLLLLAALSTASSARADGRTDGDAEMGRKIQQVLHAHQRDVVDCVAASPAPPGGEILVRVFVGDGGRVARSEILKDQSNGGPVGACITAKMQAWDLSSLEAGVGDQVVFPIAFRPEAEGSAELERLRLGRSGPAVACSQATPQALFAVDNPVKVNETFLGSGDALLLPGGAPCLAQVAVMASASLLRVRVPAARIRAPRVVRAVEVKPLSILGGGGRAMLYLDGADMNFALDTLTADAGVKIPPHVHDASDELLYILSGRGTTTVAGEPRPIGPGDLLIVPKSVEHSLVVDEKLAAVQVYVPGGPEQRFKRANAPKARGLKESR